MFFKYDEKSVRLTGRWAKNDNYAVTTANGSKIEFMFSGKMAIIHFDMVLNEHPYPHLWIQVDDGARIETTVDKFIRISSESNGPHKVTIVCKSSVERQHRWHEPLVARYAFKGFEAEGASDLPEVERRYMEFVGDSITEGVLIDEEYRTGNDDEVLNRPFQDDSTATYAYLTATDLGFEPLIMGYGAVGLTRSGAGGVPRTGISYNYCYENQPTDMPEPEYIITNLGANDRFANVDAYLKRYAELLDIISQRHSSSKIIILGAFCGFCHNELKDFVKEYNDRTSRSVDYIDTNGWIPLEPLHPDRKGHRIIADNLIKELKLRNIR